MISHKIKLKPNNKQITYFKKSCGISRLAWNWGLAEWENQYKAGLKPSGMSLKKQFTSIKETKYPFTYDVPAHASQKPFFDLQKAYNRYFNKTAGKPKFKKKGKSKDSFCAGRIKIGHKSIRIPNLGDVRLTELPRFEGRIISATVSRQADSWFISLTIEPTVSFQPCENQAIVGIDVGISNLVTLSNGIQVQAPKPLKANLKKLTRMQRSLSRKQHSRTKGDRTPKSKNYLKQQNKVARLYMKISNIRKDTLHKLTNFLTNNFQCICIEDLNIKGMMSNGKLSRAISDLGLFEFRRQLEYKSELKGNELVYADRWFPSSKTCSCCGSIKQELLLKDRIYICDKCGAKLNRDLNASLNLKAINKFLIVPQVLRELTPVEMKEMLNLNGLVTSIVEAGNKYLLSKAS